MTVDLGHRPACRIETLQLVGRVGKAYLAVDGDAIVVPKEGEFRKSQMPGERDRFLGDAFHEATVAGNDISAMIDEIRAEFRRKVTFGNGHADRISHALAQRTGCCLDS